MKKWLRQLLCKHEYSVAGTILFKGHTICFLECMRCGKRKFRMWKKKEIEIDFEGSIDEK